MEDRNADVAERIRRIDSRLEDLRRRRLMVEEGDPGTVLGRYTNELLEIDNRIEQLVSMRRVLINQLREFDGPHVDWETPGPRTGLQF